MVFISHFLALICIFLISFISPGYYIASKLRLNPLETFCTSIAFSFLIIYLGSFAVYCLHLPPFSLYFMTGLFLFATLGRLKELRKMMFHPEVKKPVLFFLSLFIWCLGLLAMVRHYSGALWTGDWIEHYHRSLFFLNHLPLNTHFIGLWILPARPPLMNVVAGFYLGQIGQHFYLFQVTFLLLNLMTFFPACLMAHLMFRKNQYWIAMLTILFMLNPMFVQNVIFTWTKIFTAFYVILGVYFYVRSLQNQSSTHLVLGFINASIGFLVHFSAGPYLLFLIIHYVGFAFWKRRDRWKEVFISVSLSLIILFSWFGWSMDTFGIKKTFLSNSTAIDTKKLSASRNVVKIGQNIVNTLIPHPFRTVDLSPIKQESYLGFLRDYFFLIYQTNLIIAMGISGGVIIIYLIWIAIKSRRIEPHVKSFWGLFIAFCTITGIAAHGGFDQYGLAHISLQPLVILGIIFLSVKIWNCTKKIKFLFLTGLLIDFLFGILLHFSLLNRVFHIEKTDTGQIFLTMPNALSFHAALNWYTKERNNLVFWGDFFSSAVTPIQISLLIFGCLMLFYLAKKFGSMKI